MLGPVTVILLASLVGCRAQEGSVNRISMEKGIHHHVLHEHHLRNDSYRETNQKLFSRIASDLEQWSDGISLEMVERTYCTDYISTLRMQIVDGEVYFVGEMEGFLEFHRMAKLFILDTAMRHKLPDVDIVLTTFDNCPEAKPPVFGEDTPCARGAPLFSFSRAPNHDHCVLFPTFTFGPGGWPLAKIPSWDTFLGLMNFSDGFLKPLQERRKNLFFRGAPTGMRDDIIGRLSGFDFGDIEMDVKTTGWTGLTSTREYIPLPAHCDYKYLLNLPGNGYASRLRYLMRCGSVPIFYDNDIQEFWYHAMEENVHAVKLKPPNPHNGQDGATAIWQAVKDLEANPQLAESIAENSLQFVENILATDNVQRYFVELLRAYASLQTFQPKVSKDAVHIRYSAMGPDATNRIDTRDCSYCINLQQSG